jgi:hypothetical protein
MEGVGLRSLVCNTLGVKGAHWSSGMGTRTNKKLVNYSYKSTQSKQQVG